MEGGVSLGVGCEVSKEDTTPSVTSALVPMIPCLGTVYYFHASRVIECWALLCLRLCVLGFVKGTGLVLAGS